MNNYKDDLKFENLMSQWGDKYYKKIFGENIKIEKNFTENNNNKQRILDQEMGIDKVITTSKRNIITVQEKSRRSKYKDMNDLTIEYMSNVDNGTKGEFFHLYAQYYTYIKADYGDETIHSIHIFRIPQLMEFLNEMDEFDFENLKRYNKGWKKGHSNASFLAIPFSIIPENCIYKKWVRGENNDK